MLILSRKTLRDFWERHAQAQQPLQDWYMVAKAARWQNLAEVRRDFPQADAVGTECTCFNIGGKKYRLLVRINYDKQKIFIRWVLTHAEYNHKPYKTDCGVKN